MQKTFKNQQGRVYRFMKVPNYSSDFEIIKVNYLHFNFSNSADYDVIKLPLANYQILYLAKDATEEQASEIVHYTLKDGYLKCYYNYVVKHYTHSLFDAKESLTSLLISLGFKQDDNVLILEKNNLAKTR